MLLFTPGNLSVHQGTKVQLCTHSTSTQTLSRAQMAYWQTLHILQPFQGEACQQTAALHTISQSGMACTSHYTYWLNGSSSAQQAGLFVPIFTTS
jgi:hypothetical protein